MPDQASMNRSNAYCGCLSGEPDLGALMRDPMTLALMAADRVERRDLEVLLAGARQNLRSHRVA